MNDDNCANLPLFYEQILKTIIWLHLIYVLSLFSIKSGLQSYQAVQSESKVRIMPKYVKIPKNTDKNCFYKNRQSKVCKVCRKNKEKIINHYVKMHKNSEVFISRLSPEMAVKVKKNAAKVQCVNNIITTFCYFCEFDLQKNIKDWLLHFTMHTGEYMYNCIKCSEKVSGSRHCQHPCLESPELALKTQDDLIAYICNDCNYIQLNKENLERHLRHEHDLNGNINACYQRIVLVTLNQQIKTINQRRLTLHQASPPGNFFY